MILHFDYNRYLTNYQIFYESHKGTWVDQEKKVEPVEEFPPPPMPFLPPQKQLDRQETTTPIADLGQEAMMSFPKTPILDKPQVPYKNIKAAVAQDQQNPKTMDSRPVIFLNSSKNIYSKFNALLLYLTD
jgi:hypothetical protein